MADDPNRPVNTDGEAEVRVYDAPETVTSVGSGSRLVWIIVIVIIILLILWWIF